MYQYLPTDAEHIFIYGRTKVQNPLPLFWTASGIEFCTSAGEVWVSLEARYDHKEIWIQVEMDGVLLQRMMLPKGKQDYCLFREFPEDYVKKIRILQSAQPFQDDEKRLLLIHEIKASQPLEVMEKKAMNIEVVGDSLTSGEGLLGVQDISGWCAGVFGINGHYGRRIAEYFNADFRLVSQSGWGVYCAWDNDPYHRIPPYYEQICGLLNGEEQIQYGARDAYDFSEWAADVVIINLGTNDGNGSIHEPFVDPKTGKEYKLETKEDGSLSEIGEKHLKTAVIEFLKQVRRCNPNSHIIWAYGMCGYLVKRYLEQAVSEYIMETQDQKTEFVLLPEMKMEQRGSNFHPGSLDHQASSEVLIERIKKFS